MRVKSRVTGDKMSVVDGTVDEARRMSEFMLHKAWRGYGITDAANQAELKWGAPASILLRFRNREVSDMLLSNWIRIVVAAANAGYQATCEAIEEAGDKQEQRAREAGHDETNSSRFAMGVILDTAEAQAARLTRRRL